MTAIVLLPGMDGTGTLFADFIAALGWNAIVISYPKDQALDYDQLEALVASRLPADEPYILLAESFSGPIAISLAAKAPPMLEGLVLVCTFAKLRLAYAPGVMHRLISWLPFWKLPISLGATALLGSFDSAQMRARLSSAIEPITPTVWRTRMRSVLNVDVTQPLQRIRKPVLYLRASADRIVPMRASESLPHISTSVEIVTIDGPHALLQCNPTASAAAVRTFARNRLPSFRHS